MQRAGLVFLSQNDPIYVELMFIGGCFQTFAENVQKYVCDMINGLFRLLSVTADWFILQTEINHNAVQSYLFQSTVTL